MAFYNLLCCTTLSLADANVVQFYSCLNRCCRGLCWCPGTTSSLELGKSSAVRAIPSLRLSHGGERKTGRVKPFVGAIFVTALNGLLMSDFPEKKKYHPYMVIWEALCIFGYTIALEFLEEYMFSKMFPIWAVPSSNATHLDIYAALLNSCSFSHQWHKPQTHNTWFQAQRKAAAAPDNSRCDFFWAVNVHSLFLSRNSCAEQSSQSCHLWLYSGTSLHRIQCHNRHMKLENQEWHEEIHVVCK